jgi:hypothetical protein
MTRPSWQQLLLTALFGVLTGCATYGGGGYYSLGYGPRADAHTFQLSYGIVRRDPAYGYRQYVPGKFSGDYRHRGLPVYRYKGRQPGRYGVASRYRHGAGLQRSYGSRHGRGYGQRR